MIANINPYDRDVFERRFRQTEIFQRLQSDFEIVSFDKFSRRDALLMTPRQWCGTKIFSAVPFYYINFLLDHAPTHIYDLGCGWNIFKKYIPHIVGIGEEAETHPSYHADIHGRFDEDFLQSHINYFESLFAINSLHFVPLSDLRHRMQDFSSMLSPNGVGFITFNIGGMIRNDQHFADKTIDWLDRYVREQLDIPGIEYLVFDVDLNAEDLDEWMNGNARFVLRKL